MLDAIVAIVVTFRAHDTVATTSPLRHRPNTAYADVSDEFDI